jgi:hypothetical protein
VKTTTACRNGIITASVLFLTGCFSYVAAPIETVPAGTDIRVYLTRQALADLPEPLEQDGPVLEGTLVRREDERVFIRVPIAVRQEGFHASTVGQDVSLSAGEIVQLERRRLDRAGTALLVGGTAASAAAVIFLIMDAFGEPGRTDPPVEEFRIPLFSFHVR